MRHARPFRIGERTQHGDDRAPRPVPRSRQPVHLVTLTPEDLPGNPPFELRWTCCGKEARHRVPVAARGIPTASERVIYGRRQRVSSQKVLGLVGGCNTLLLRRFSSTERLCERARDGLPAAAFAHPARPGCCKKTAHATSMVNHWSGHLLQGLSLGSASPILISGASHDVAIHSGRVDAQTSLIDSVNEFAFSIDFRQQ
jgi:hypothetical protein